MTEQEWLASEDPAAMLSYLCSPDLLEPEWARPKWVPSDRKLRLIEDAAYERFGLNLDDLAVQSVPPAGAAALLREIVGNPFRPYRRFGSAVCDGKMKELFEVTPTTIGMAEHAYDTRDFAGLPILADALEEAGCDSGPLLMHLRGWFPAGANSQTPLFHVRGCWALDLIIGKG